MVKFGKYTGVPFGRKHMQWEVVKNATLNEGWQKLLQVSTPHLSIDWVNTWVNHHITYRVDELDIWQQPQLTLHNATGDCEDFAILKRAMIREIFPDKDVWLIVGYDNILRTNHAVLLVDSQVLDNTHNNLHTPQQITGHFRPMMAYNEKTQCIFADSSL